MIFEEIMFGDILYLLKVLRLLRNLMGILERWAEKFLDYLSIKNGKI